MPFLGALPALPYHQSNQAAIVNFNSALLQLANVQRANREYAAKSMLMEAMRASEGDTGAFRSELGRLVESQPQRGFWGRINPFAAPTVGWGDMPTGTSKLLMAEPTAYSPQHYQRMGLTPEESAKAVRVRTGLVPRATVSTQGPREHTFEWYRDVIGLTEDEAKKAARIHVGLTPRAKAETGKPATYSPQWYQDVIGLSPEEAAKAARIHVGLESRAAAGTGEPSFVEKEKIRRLQKRLDNATAHYRKLAAETEEAWQPYEAEIMGKDEKRLLFKHRERRAKALEQRRNRAGEEVNRLRKKLKEELSGLGMKLTDANVVGGQTTTQPATQPAIPRITTDEEYDSLPSGVEFVAPDGTIRRKP